MFIGLVWLGIMGLLTIVDDLMPNPLDTCILNKLFVNTFCC